MTFSVIVAWRGSAEELRRCLQSLDGQVVDQVVVSRTHEAAYTNALAEEFPSVCWVEPAVTSDLPGLFWRALGSVTGDVVGTLESPSTAGPSWVEHHLKAHVAHPDAFAVGGPVRPPTTASGFDSGWHWSEFVAYAPGRAAEVTRDLTDANVSYKREALEEHEDRLVGGYWGWQLRKAADRASYFTPDAWIEYPNPLPLGSALRQHCEGGRKHAAAKQRSAGGRLMGLFTAPLLPLVLTWRGWQLARVSDCGSSYVAAVPWTLLFHSAWALGESRGYISSRPPVV